MNYARALGFTSGKLSENVEHWLAEIAPVLQSQHNPTTETVLLRERLEALRSYLPTISFARAAYRKKIAEFRKDYVTEHGPRPDKEVKKWDEAFKAALGDIHIIYELLGDLHEDISKGISATQTQLRSQSDEMSSYA